MAVRMGCSKVSFVSTRQVGISWKPNGRRYCWTRVVRDPYVWNTSAKTPVWLVIILSTFRTPHFVLVGVFLHHRSTSLKQIADPTALDCVLVHELLSRMNPRHVWLRSDTNFHALTGKARTIVMADRPLSMEAEFLSFFEQRRTMCLDAVSPIVQIWVPHGKILPFLPSVQSVPSFYGPNFSNFSFSLFFLL